MSAIDTHWRTIWIADAHRDDGKRFVVRADEILTAFVELKTAIRALGIVLDAQSEILIKKITAPHTRQV